MAARTPYFEAELHIPVKPALAGMAFIGWGLALLLKDIYNPLVLTAGLVTHLLLTGLAWALDERLPQFSHWYCVLSATAGIVLLDAHRGIASALLLMALPTILATALMSVEAALLTAGVETALIVALSWRGSGMGLDSWAALAAVWSTFGLMAGMSQRATWLYRWLGSSFQQMHALLEESRDQKAQLAQTLQDLQHANRQLMLAHDRTTAFRDLAEVARQGKADFVAKVSHEFRTPLNMIIGLVDLMVESPELYGQALPPELNKDLEIVHRNSSHLASMVNDVLDLSRLEAGYMTLRKIEVDLREMVTKAVAVVQPLVDKKGLELTLDIPDDVGDLVCDPVRIRQVILNLISNAARFTEVGGLTVRVIPKPASIVVSVSDTGPGIHETDAKRIFEPFRQAVRQPQGKSGTGLGLSLSKQFVELHGGRIWLETEHGVGSTFSFELPRRGPSAPVTSPGRWIQEGWEWMARSSHLSLPDATSVPRIISCDSTHTLTAALARHTDQVEIVDAPTLGDAFETLRDCPAHALIVNAPTPDQMWLMVEEARRGATDTPIIGCSIPPRHQRALSAGAHDYLIKPISRQDLAGLLAACDYPVRRILLVDDDPDLLDLIVRLFALIDGAVQVVKAGNGREGLATLEHEQIDLVLLDLVMPEMDGWAFLEEKNRDPEMRDVPVVLITAQDPSNQPMSSPALVLGAQEGISVSRLLQTALAFSAIQISPNSPQPPKPQ